MADDTKVLRDVADMQTTTQGMEALRQSRTEALAAASKDIPVLQKALHDRLPASDHGCDEATKTFHAAYNRVEGAIVGVLNKHGLETRQATDEEHIEMDKEQDTFADHHIVPNSMSIIGQAQIRDRNRDYAKQIMDGILYPTVTKEHVIGSGGVPAAGPQQSNGRPR